MSRPILLVFLLVILVITSQIEWRQQHQQLVVETTDAISSSSSGDVSTKRNSVSNHQEQVKEKIILSQERHIQKLNDLVETLREQLQKCRGDNETTTASIPLTEHVIEVERQQIIEDK